MRNGSEGIPASKFCRMSRKAKPIATLDSPRMLISSPAVKPGMVMTSDQQTEEHDQPLAQPAQGQAEVEVRAVALGDGAHPGAHRHPGQRHHHEHDEGDREIRHPLEKALDHRRNEAVISPRTVMAARGRPPAVRRGYRRPALTSSRVDQ